MKTKKLNLNDLKVESFVTSLESKESQTVKGGTQFHATVSTILVAEVVTAVAIVAAVAATVVVAVKK